MTNKLPSIKQQQGIDIIAARAELYEAMAQEHKLTLLESELDDIISIVQKHVLAQIPWQLVSGGLPEYGCHVLVLRSRRIRMAYFSAISKQFYALDNYSQNKIPKVTHYYSINNIEMPEE